MILHSSERVACIKQMQDSRCAFRTAKFGSGRGSLPAGQLLDAFGQIQVGHGNGDYGLVAVIGSATQSFDQRNGENSVMQFSAFGGQLIACGGGEDNNTVFRTGKLICQSCR